MPPPSLKGAPLTFSVHNATTVRTLLQKEPVLQVYTLFCVAWRRLVYIADQV
jgi:hypothetical protein